MSDDPVLGACRRALRREDELAVHGALDHRTHTVEHFPDGRAQHTFSGSLIRTPPEYAAVYERRGVIAPVRSSSFDPAALWPYLPREPHEAHARVNGYFWLPCELCGRHFGGHEITSSMHLPGSEPGILTRICPVCTAERNGGEP
ncbi:hypothetical protein [Nocardia blacklockiae]|uniref:hypothetical protein n=1 Tax=Nocardia blacklockiae TaxID=480036 RepID=UPI001895F8AA|nr:hypothetical protein [Nocardia blacklockiae]MBF6174038.1 hypothetical protein [Nocardia blacklockiae]